MTRVASSLALLLALSLSALPSRGLAQPAGQPTGRPAPPEITALVGGTLMRDEGEPLSNATVILSGARIVSVTAGGAPPAGARVLDCTGTVITAGFVGTQEPIGLVEISLEAETADLGPEAEHSDPIRASFSAVDGYNPSSTLIPIARRGGVTSVVSTPVGGLVSGTSAWVDLFGPTLDDVLVREVAALHVDLDDGGVQAGGGARSSAINRLREAFDDARLYRTRRAAFDSRGLRELSISRLDLERLSQALGRDFPVVVRVSRSSDILRVLAFARSYGLRLVIAGAEEGWLVARQIAAADVPVILQPMTNLPSHFSRLHSRYDNAALLSQAGVRLVFTTDGPHGLRNLRQEAGNAIAHGLPPEIALRALTLEPARVFGVDDRYGAVAPGRVANLVVWTGDPFELTTWARNVFVRGQDVPLQTRQSLLFERYRDLATVPRGQRGLRRQSER